MIESAYEEGCVRGVGAEQTGRRAFLMELDQAYCDVVVDRDQRFTGKPAVLDGTGESPIPMATK